MEETANQRLEMHLELREKLGDTVANTLMEHLPPSGWSDVARTRDIYMIRQEIQNLEVRTDARLDMIDLQLAQLSKRVSYAITSGIAIFATLLALLVDMQFSI